VVAVENSGIALRLERHLARFERESVLTPFHLLADFA
jgi:hypothetical protein